MQNKNFLARLQASWPQHRFKLTRTRALLFAATLIAVGLALGGLQVGGEIEEAGLAVLELELPAHDVFQRPPLAAGPQASPLAGDGAPPAEENWEEVVVRPGQSLDAIFREQGLSIGTLQEILALNDATRQLTNIRPGDVFEFQRHDDHSLKRMRFAVDEGRFVVIESGADGLAAATEVRDLLTRTTEASGVIRSSLFVAGKEAGLSDSMVMNLANLFGWDIDFALDIRAGDRFYLVYEKVYRDGEFLRDGEIVGATFINQGEKFQAVRFEADGRTQYFAPDGRNMRKAFLRAPLNFSYVSSNFNPKRFHPILKQVKPHNGIDYRAPTGTPVYAAGDGKVTRSAYSKYNGHHVFIQHANSIVTKYLHFSKRAVKQGQRVKQGQVIGYVGSTGLAQAPHLHYEFLLNGVHRNPRTVSLPKADPLPDDLLAEFRVETAPVLSMLGRLESASMYAISP
ncbi:MAG: peptidoglycan DD-metalloendopeptidase family protein [Lysobacterales bacterium]|jgi:murein DD-endopeptidase MepM/ murein hydrolase activator NlpD